MEGSFRGLKDTARVETMDRLKQSGNPWFFVFRAQGFQLSVARFDS